MINTLHVNRVVVFTILALKPFTLRALRLPLVKIGGSLRSATGSVGGSGEVEKAGLPNRGITEQEVHFILKL